MDGRRTSDLCKPGGPSRITRDGRRGLMGTNLKLELEALRQERVSNSISSLNCPSFRGKYIFYMNMRLLCKTGCPIPKVTST